MFVILRPSLIHYFLKLQDSFVSLQELKDWILLTQKRYIIEDTERQWKSLNPNDETEVSWENYKIITYGITSGNSFKSYYLFLLLKFYI